MFNKLQWYTRQISSLNWRVYTYEFIKYFQQNLSFPLVFIILKKMILQNYVYKFYKRLEEGSGGKRAKSTGPAHSTKCDWVARSNSITKLTLPNLPNLHNLPDLPKIPDLPNLPHLPDWHHPPNLHHLPNLPHLPNPEGHLTESALQRLPT